MLADFGLLQDLEAYAFSPASLPMCVLGDPAYPLRFHLQGLFQNPHLTPLVPALGATASLWRSFFNTKFCLALGFIHVFEFERIVTVPKIRIFGLIIFP